MIQLPSRLREIETAIDDAGKIHVRVRDTENNRLIKRFGRNGDEAQRRVMDAANGLHLDDAPEIPGKGNGGK